MRLEMLSARCANHAVRDHPRRFECRFCPYVSNWKDVLTRHERIHTGERPYECHVCNYKFSLRHHLMRHFRCHTGEKPHRCTACSKCFSQKETLTRHLIQPGPILTTNWMYKCPLCPYVSRWRHAVLRHSRTHCPDGPYRCSICPSTFVKESQLNRHMRFHSYAAQD
ncbi:zinc finger and SCAN domain-containing protein 22-like [Ornithodoros turicata]|uniref:zinc finger and SCAN domain-containing protein 22-like n=1 Tax=Ornithodoros turicata TaxID=34597 RepID=UPI0031394C9B